MRGGPKVKRLKWETDETEKRNAYSLWKKKGGESEKEEREAEGGIKTRSSHMTGIESRQD